MTLDLTKLKLQLLMKGVISKTEIDKGRKSGAGPTGGRYFLLENGSCINIPLWPHFTKNSQFQIEKKEDQENIYNLYEGNNYITTLKLIPKPKFYDLYTSDKIQMKKIAMLHGKDCLASTIYQKCIYWSQGKACIFCGIELSLQSNTTILKKTGRQLSEVLDASLKEGICKHMTLTTGTPNVSDKGAKMYFPILKELKKNFSIPIHIQLEPPNDKEYIDQLYSCGADTIGIHSETLDPTLFPQICPGKSEIGLQKYRESWSHCVDVFGKSQVSSYLLIWPEESLSSIQNGAQYLIELGVIPYIVPVRPVLNTNIEHQQVEYTNTIYQLYKAVKNSIKQNGLDPLKNKAGCVRCGACSIISDAL
ncbi:MAG: MSMEG_0568 family radical SAM protein [Candidatus Helarchaeota archaeon]|nr:MSMEG_0568 family radical SAM protein [Candidatus Helarchaeota archaeon]